MIVIIDVIYVYASSFYVCVCLWIYKNRDKASNNGTPGGRRISATIFSPPNNGHHDVKIYIYKPSSPETKTSAHTYACAYMRCVRTHPILRCVYAVNARMRKQKESRAKMRRAT